MANSYIAIPNVLPGNVTIGGNLTVAGNVLTVGSFTEKLRLAVDSANQAKLSWNQQGGGSTRDNAAKVAQALFLGAGTSQLDLEVQNTAGALMDTAVPQTIFTNFTQQTNTGNTTENTIYSKTIRANLIGANAGLWIRTRLVATLQGAGNTSVRVRMGGTLVGTCLISAADNGLQGCLDFWIYNVNSLSSQVAYTDTAFNGVLPATAKFTSAINTGADQVLTVTAQNANAGDQQTFDAISIILLNIWGPVT